MGETEKVEKQAKVNVGESWGRCAGGLGERGSDKAHCSNETNQIK